MSESLKATIGGVILLSVIGSLMAWLAAGVPDTPVVWSLRILLPLIVFASAATLVRAMTRKDIEPDFIREMLGKPFERDGACFFLSPVTRGGICYIDIAFQNRYERPCHLRIVAQPPVKSFTMGKRPFAGVTLDIRCEGGAFGLARVPMAIPARHQGRAVRFEVAAATQYPEGGGELLRFRNGLRVGKADASGLGSAAVTAALLTIGVIHISRPAIATLALPTNVAEALPPDVQPDIQTLWIPHNGADLTAEDLQRAIHRPPAHQDQPRAA